MVNPRDQKIPLGYTCDCGKVTHFPAYVFAHWYDPLVYTCNKCGRKAEVCEGVATAIEPAGDKG